MGCDTKDFVYPMQADIFYPIVEQTPGYGSLKKQWVHDRTIICNFTFAGSAFKEEIKPNRKITQDAMLVGRVKEDVRLSQRQEPNSITNVIITNIRDSGCNEIYLETAGPRQGKSTIFEIATQEPFMSPFGQIEYYKVLLRRSENQAADL